MYGYLLFGAHEIFARWEDTWSNYVKKRLLPYLDYSHEK